MVDLCGPTDYVSAGDKAAMCKAARNGFEWDYWKASKSQKYKVENKVLANALVDNAGGQTSRLKGFKSRSRREKRRKDWMQ